MTWLARSRSRPPNRRPRASTRSCSCHQMACCERRSVVREQERIQRIRGAEEDGEPTPVRSYGIARGGVSHEVDLDQIVGLSKLARLVDFYARRPQVQERMTEQIVACLNRRLEPKGAMVVLQARHFCMEMRGVSKPGVLTSTSALSGAFEEERVRQEFLSLIPSRTSLG